MASQRQSPGHRQSKKRRHLTWAVAGAAVVAGAGLAAQTSMAATTWPAQRTYTGRAFDTCAAPSLAAMRAWRTNNFYGAAAVYIGGRNRGCTQPNLTASWVKSVSAQGWKLIPCTSAPSRPARPAPAPRSSPPPRPPPSARTTRRTR